MSLKQLKPTLLLAIPITLSQLGQTLFGLMDTAMIGEVGTTPLSASAFVNNVFNVPLVFLLGMSSAVSVLTSHQFGAKNYKECGRILNHSFIYLLIISLLITFGLEILGFYLNIFNQPQEVLEISHSYYRYIIWSIIPITLFFGVKQFLEATGRPYIGVIAIAIGLIFNFILNSLLIHGLYGFPEMGLDGAGLATLISRTISLIVIVSFLFFDKKILLLKPSKLEFYDKFHLKKFIQIGVPSGFQYFFEVMAFAGSGIMMGWIGVKELAAHQIVIQIASITFMFALGLSFATSVRVGQLKGQSNFEEIRKTGFSSFIFISLFNLIFGILMVIFKDTIPQMFVQDPDVWLFAGQLFIIAALFQIFDATQAIGVSVQRALEDIKIPTLITFSAYWIIALPLAYLLAFKFDFFHIGIWLGLWAGLTFSSVALIYRFHKISKKLILTQKNIIP